MKIAAFGGTFDPVHNGHMKLASKLIETLNFDQVLLIPAKEPYQKLSKSQVTSFSLRFQMLEIACENNRNIRPSNIELEIEGPSYTITTFNRLKELYPTDEIWVVIGSDLLKELNTWYRYEELVNQCKFLIAQKDPSDASSKFAKALGIKTYLTIEAFEFGEISSTKIRAAIREKQPVSHIIDPRVLDFIMRNGLYLN